MVKSCNIKGWNVTIGFKSKYPKPAKPSLEFNRYWRKMHLGFVFEKNKIVGKKGFNKPKTWKDNFVNSYMFGINLVIMNMWVSWDHNGMHLKE